MRLVLIGFGNVGQALARLLLCTGRSSDFRVVGIATATRGTLVNPSGLDLARALSDLDRMGRFPSDHPDLQTAGSLELAQTCDFDALVELSPLRIETGGEPATSHLRAALEKGRHAVTANKGPIAFAYRELSSLAQSNRCQLKFESTVMDGAPVFNLARSCLTGTRVLGVKGILNSTTNFVLSQMEAGKTLESGIKQAQQQGFAEADPRLDLEGWDGAAKLCVLVNALMDAEISPFEVERESLLGLPPDRLRQAAHAGKRLKYVCRARLAPNGIDARVALEEFAADHLFAAVSGAGSILSIETDLMTPISIAQENPTPADTAYGVLADLLDLKPTQASRL